MSSVPRPAQRLPPTAPLPAAEASELSEELPLLLIELIRPQLIVQLGVAPTSYGTVLCEAVAALGTTSRCLIINTTPEDESEAVKAWWAGRERLYDGFLQRLPQAAALAQLADGTIELLSLNGEAPYAALRSCLETWVPKLSPRAVLVFHNLQAHGGGLKLWKQQASRHPHLALPYAGGLGLLAPGELPPRLTGLLNRVGPPTEGTPALSALLATRLVSQLAAARMELRTLATTVTQRDTELARLRLEVARAQDETLYRELKAVQLERSLATHDQLYSKIQNSLSFRLGMAATAPMRWLVERLAPARR